MLLIEPWVLWTLLAAVMQSVRTAGQKVLVADISAVSATLVRYLFGLPFALLYLGWLSSRRQWQLPELNLDFLVNKWHTTPTWGMAAIALAAIWQMSGYTMALYLAGLRSIPQELREAAQIDGANEIQIYRHIILPLLAPVTLSALIILGHMSLKVFDLIIAIAGKQTIGSHFHFF